MTAIGAATGADSVSANGKDIPHARGAAGDAVQADRSLPPTTQIVFQFPIASGHVNPALSIAQQLSQIPDVDVHFLVSAQLKDAVEAVGATFHDEVHWQPEFFTAGPGETEFEAAKRHMYEAGFAELPSPPSIICEFRMMRYFRTAKRVPGTVRFLEHIGASAVVYDPILAGESLIAARYLNLPTVALLTVAGPGCLESLQTEADDAWYRENAPRFQPLIEAVTEVNETYGVQPQMPLIEKFTLLDTFSAETVVTTIEYLADPCSEEFIKALADQGSNLHYVGPLLDGQTQVGTNLAVVKKKPAADQGSVPDEMSLIEKVRAAKKRGARVLYASLGTVITSSVPTVGWEARMPLPNSVGGGHDVLTISGKELCQSAWRAVFENFGIADGADSEPGDSEWLIVVSIGSQPDALDGISVPRNAVCEQSVPQVQLLNEGVDLFLTHGGQNSFMEAMSCGTPIVVCPGFADQPMNAAKAESIGVGLKVDRAPQGQESKYQRDVAAALRAVADDEGTFAVNAQKVAKMIAESHGMQAAVSVILNTVRGPTLLSNQ
mmetsp:Transcript_32767/g.92963  ORF Transcript_32767/g.92963 Transcript_32767/m.92963 type:complete len:550 (+) Transcript_32767:194-1843(+)|eukprot:CAMPEP_0117674918 /NCGR_PEP_ID=MMETSP0804-20121206/15316_1 /TAXON_ID=1074897 /ORGANISM="Tetraselmis astigmatica, Strain CCMP880" /LENGTH=549 /DNA_ID=CAMNT_0005483863 /DNA_START=110 /DNA_END=1759 /DNA_ORIENTATION=-